MSDAALEAVIDHALSTEWTHVDEAAREASRRFLADTLAVGVAGSVEPSAHRVRRAAAGWGSASEARILGHDDLVPVTSAAFVNAFQIHCQEFDCLHEPATVHAMAVLGGVLTALAHRERLSVRQALMATVTGVDVAAGLGLSATRGLSFFRPATAGAMGSGAALGACLGLSATEIRDLMGLIHSQLAGTMQAHVEGSEALPIQIAAAARAVLTALDLVRAGLTGPHHSMTGPFGYFALFEPGGDPSILMNQLSRGHRVAELSHKPFPTGRAAHAILDGIQRLRATHALDLSSVERIQARVPPLIARLVQRPAHAEMGSNHARLCIGFLSAAMLRDGQIDRSTFTDNNRSDPDLLAMAERVHVEIDDNPNPNALSPQQMEILTRDGSRLAIDMPHTLGSPANPLTYKQQTEKIARCFEEARQDTNTVRIEPGQLLALDEDLPLSQVMEDLRIERDWDDSADR